MTKKNNDSPRITQMGHAVPKTQANSKKNAGFADTLPSVHPADLKPAAQDGHGIVTSAPVRALPGQARASGTVTLSGERVAEALARELIANRMATAGYTLQPDFAFSYDDILVSLDGYDEAQKVGFQYISHADADVVTDFDSKVEERLRELASHGVANILVIHDHHATTPDSVIASVNDFLATLPTL